MVVAGQDDDRDLVVQRRAQRGGDARGVHWLEPVLVCEVNFAEWTDIAAPGLALGQAIGRWGNFMNQEAHGGEVSRSFLESLMLPEWIINQMYIDGAYYHPTFLYEVLWNGLGVLVLPSAAEGSRPTRKMRRGPTSSRSRSDRRRRPHPVHPSDLEPDGVRVGARTPSGQNRLMLIFL